MVRRIKNSAHFLIALLVLFYLQRPSKKLKIIGVTGTDGKTTTSSFIYQLLLLSGKKAALISTVGVFMDGKNEPLGHHVTTPSSFTINKYLKKAIELNIEFVVIEVSSHAIDQFRVYGIEFDAGTITNISNEHLDYHKDMESYLNTKLKLLKVSKKVVLDCDSPFFEKIKNKLKNKKIYTYSLSNRSASLNYDGIKNSSTEKMISYNKKNLLNALLMLETLGFDSYDLSKFADKLELPPGRLTYLKTTPFCVIVDFAHTPNAFNVLLSELKSRVKGRIIHVFGSAGKRDKLKRPDMGSESSKYADVIILTAEDPRNEKVSDINNDIKNGISDKFQEVIPEEYKSKINSAKKLIEINDRREAIKFALSIAEKDDCVIITGKGPEKSMNINGKEIPWDDLEIAKKLIN